MSAHDSPVRGDTDDGVWDAVGAALVVLLNNLVSLVALGWIAAWLVVAWWNTGTGTPVAAAVIVATMAVPAAFAEHLRRTGRLLPEPVADAVVAPLAERLASSGGDRAGGSGTV